MKEKRNVPKRKDNDPREILDKKSLTNTRVGTGVTARNPRNQKGFENRVQGKGMGMT